MKTRKQRAAGLIGRCVLAGAGIVGLAVMIGCESEGEAQAGRVIGTGLMASPYSTPEEVMLGAMMNTAGQTTLNSINAEKMGTNVNVNVYGGMNGKDRYITIYTIHGDTIKGRYIREDDKEIVIEQNPKWGFMYFPKDAVKSHEFRR